MNAAHPTLDLQDQLHTLHRHARGVASLFAHGDLGDVPQVDLSPAIEVVYSVLARAEKITQEIGFRLHERSGGGLSSTLMDVFNRLHEAHVSARGISALLAHGELEGVPDGDLRHAAEALFAFIGTARQCATELGEILRGEGHGGAA